MSGVIYALHFGGRRRYIGSAVNLKRRIHMHFSALRRGVHHSRFLQRATNKHGIEKLTVEILAENIPHERLLAEEQKLLDANWGNLYNCSPTAGSRLGCKDTPAETERKRLAWTGNKFRAGKTATTETKDKMSASQKLAWLEGRRVRTSNINLRKFMDEVAHGMIPNPFKRPFSQIIQALADLAATKSFRKTGENIGVQAQIVRDIYINAHRDLTEIMDGQMSPRRRRDPAPFIHPDWFDVLEEALS